MKDYASDVNVSAEGAGAGACRIDWSGSFTTSSVPDADAQVGHLHRFYVNGIEACGARQSSPAAGPPGRRT